MKLDFDLDNVTLTEFGVGRGNRKAPTFLDVRVEAKVQATLLELVKLIWDEMQSDSGEPLTFDPSELYPHKKYVFVGRTEYEDSFFSELHLATGIVIGSNIIEDPHKNFCYYTRLKDKQNRYLTALRGTSQFKGSLSQRSKLVRLVADTLTIEEDNLFKLENDFDLLIDSEHIHVWKPSAFVSLGNLNQQIRDAVPTNISKIQQKMPYVHMESLNQYASKYLRAAKLLKSVCNQQLDDIVREELVKECGQSDVEVSQANGNLVVADGHEIGFLEILNRQRYSVSLVPGSRERYRATSRSIIN